MPLPASEGGPATGALHHRQVGRTGVVRLRGEVPPRPRLRRTLDDRVVANSIVRDVGAGMANAIVCGSVLSRALRVRPSISAE